MDTTKENILMCEKATKIQKEWKAKEGDLCAFHNTYKLWFHLYTGRRI